MDQSPTLSALVLECSLKPFVQPSKDLEESSPLKLMLSAAGLKVVSMVTEAVVMEYLGQAKSDPPSLLFVPQDCLSVKGLGAIKAIKKSPRLAHAIIVTYEIRGGVLYAGKFRFFGAFGLLCDKALREMTIEEVLQEIKRFKESETKGVDQSELMNLDINRKSLDAFELESSYKDITFSAKSGENVKSCNRKMADIINHPSSLKRMAFNAIDSYQRPSVSSEGKKLSSKLTFNTVSQIEKTLVVHQAVIEQALEQHLEQQSDLLRSWVVNKKDRTVTSRVNVLLLIVLMLMLPFVWLLVQQRVIQISPVLESVNSSAASAELSFYKDQGQFMSTNGGAMTPGLYGQPELSSIQKHRLVSQVSKLLNMQSSVPFLSPPFNELAQEKLETVIAVLEDHKLSGKIEIVSAVGNFCVTYNDAGIMKLSGRAVSVLDCDFWPSDLNMAQKAGEQQTRSFSNFLASYAANSESAFELTLSSEGLGANLYEYPQVDTDIAADEWNQIAALNNRVEYRITLSQ